MKEALLRSYLIANGLNTYGTDFTIENIEDSKIVNVIQFREVDRDESHPSYYELHEINILDILTWLYSSKEW